MKVGIFINTTKSEANTTASAFGKALIDNGIDYKIVNLKVSRFANFNVFVVKFVMVVVYKPNAVVPTMVV